MPSQTMSFQHKDCFELRSLFYKIEFKLLVGYTRRILCHSNYFLLYLDQHTWYYKSLNTKITCHLNKTRGYIVRYILGFIWYQLVWLMGALAKKYTSISWYHPLESHHFILPSAQGSLKSLKYVSVASSSISDRLTVLGEMETK